MHNSSDDSDDGSVAGLQESYLDAPWRCSERTRCRRGAAIGGGVGVKRGVFPKKEIANNKRQGGAAVLTEHMVRLFARFCKCCNKAQTGRKERAVMV